MKKEDVYNDIINMYENERIHKFGFIGTKEAINKLNANYLHLEWLNQAVCKVSIFE